MVAILFTTVLPSERCEDWTLYNPEISGAVVRGKFSFPENVRTAEKADRKLVVICSNTKPRRTKQREKESADKHDHVSCGIWSSNLV